MGTFDLFLSHNSADKPWAERVARAIEADRSGPPLRVFFDKWEIAPGGDIPLELEEGLQASRYVGLVLSPEALSSDWVSLERSTALYRDPRARAKHLVPLLRRDCSLPDMLARLRYIDFRREADFVPGVQELLDLLRGVPNRRGTDATDADVHFREDAALLARHRQIFDRSAFKTPCVWELFIRELIEAIDDTAAALNTGSLYSRSSRLLSSFPSQGEYHLPEFKSAFTRVAQLLTQLKRAVVEFEAYFRSVNPSYSHHENFYAMLTSFWRNPDRIVVRRLVDGMDTIDRLRNDILNTLNDLLEKCRLDTFEPIELSSAIIRSRRIGGVDEIAPLLG